MREWLTSWTAAGLEGLARSTSSPAAPRTLLLGRYDTDLRLRYIGRSTTLPQTAGRSPHPAGDDHPWTGWTFSAGWGSRERLHVTLVEPELVVESAST
ncbi:hypothetical protein [Streptomyces echinatus]|uniref:hypothetical protein n=1 Tax=Streptomyces echinatus TaxID=67293 RepID=UPI0038090493